MSGSFWTSVILPCVFFSAFGSAVEIEYVEGTLNKSSLFSINFTHSIVHAYKINISDLQGTNAWIETTVQKKDWDGGYYCPVIFSLRHHRSSKSWALPLELETEDSQSEKLRSSRFTVCLSEYDGQFAEHGIQFMVFVSTCSETIVNYTLGFYLSQTEFLLQNDEVLKTTLSPSWQRFYRFNFPDDSDEVIVHVDSDDTICMTVAVQSPACELINGRNTRSPTRFQSLWQDMTTVAAIPVKKSDFKDGFFIGFDVHDNDRRCKSYSGVAASSWDPIRTFNNTSDENLRRKNITLQIKGDRSIDEYRLPLFVPLLLVMSVCSFTLVVYSVSTWMAKRRIKAEDQRILLNDDTVAISYHQAENRRSRSPSGQSAASQISAVFTPRENPFMRNVSSQPSSALAEPRHQDQMALYNGWLTIESFMNKKKKVKKSLKKLHLLIISVGIFYVLPTIQLLYTYHQISQSTGQDDLCYRNYLCSEKGLGLDDFNHIYSNTVYIVLGLIFCCFVLHYHDVVKRVEEEQERVGKPVCEVAGSSQQVEVEPSIVPSGHGVLHQFGVFYALGLSLCLEGVLSGTYHVCPTEMNYQFDTSFMYILASLCTIRIYQFRHPDPICPHNTFGFLALISSVSVGGILLGNGVYEKAFLLLQLIVAFLIAVYMYYVGYVLDEDGYAVTDYSLLAKCNLWTTLRRKPWSLCNPKYKHRLVFVIPFVTLNVSLSAWQLAARHSFPSYLVYLFAGNMMLYFMHYLLMKICHRELYHRLAVQPLLYTLLSGIFGILALQYFGDKRYDSSLSPAESRVLNQPCIVSDFYDSHDMWHFLSAVSIFFFFMALLTLDDAILQRPRNEIVAF